jgi:hypothetical protein
MERVHHHVECRLPDLFVGLERHDSEPRICSEIGHQYVDVACVVYNTLSRVDLRQVGLVRDDLRPLLAKEFDRVRAHVVLRLCDENAFAS